MVNFLHSRPFHNPGGLPRVWRSRRNRSRTILCHRTLRLCNIAQTFMTGNTTDWPVLFGRQVSNISLPRPHPILYTRNTGHNEYSTQWILQTMNTGHSEHSIRWTLYAINTVINEWCTQWTMYTIKDLHYNGYTVNTVIIIYCSH